MKQKHFSRRDFLRLSAATTAGLFVAGCQVVVPATQQAPAASDQDAPAAGEASAPPAEEVTLDIGATNPEYENAERQIWDIFEQENPGIKVQLFSVNEDQKAAFRAKVAGGYKPAFAPTWAFAEEGVTNDNYQMFMNLGELDFPWWDRWTWDVKNTYTELYNLPGPRALDVFSGFVFTWQYNADLMDEAGLNPREDVKSWDDMKKWLAEGAAWAAKTDGVDYFWNQAWHNWAFGANYIRGLALAFPEGQVENQAACWLGEAKFNGEDSPYRPVFEFFKEAYDNSWLPENFWTREWEADMEASYIAGTSVMMIHGPWVWDKALAAGSTFNQLGLPLTPPAEGQEVWMQYTSDLDPTGRVGMAMLDGAQELPEWEAIKSAFYWWFSPAVVPMQAEVQGRTVTYKLDEPLELTGPQWTGVLQDIGTSGGLWADAQYVDGSAWGEVVAKPHYQGGTPDTWDWASNGLVEPIEKVMTGQMTVQEILDWAQANWEKSYPELAA